jgi:hypothetical protein
MMAEKNILAYFKSPEEAEAVAGRLKKLNPIDIAIDRIEKYPGDGVERAFNPISGDVPSLGKLTLDADYSGRSAAVLSAADPSASGMSGGGDDDLDGRDILLTVVVAEPSFEEAMRLIREGGGLV